MKKVAETQDIELVLWRLFSRTQYMIRKALQRALTKSNIQLRSISVLASIIRLDEQATIAEISKELVLELHTISEHLKRLETQGLIKKIKDKKGRRITRIEVTEKGIEVYLSVIRQNTVQSIMSALTPEEKHQFWLLLEKIQDNAIKHLGAEIVSHHPYKEFME